MNILICCEESQIVLNEFLKLGHNVFSCDIENFSGNFPQYHILSDVVPLLNGNCAFTTMDGVNHFQNGSWDLIIAFPPCTFLTFAGNQCFSQKLYSYEQIVDRFYKRVQAELLFYKIMSANCDKIAIENPKGIINSSIKPSQIIQPYEFCDDYLSDDYTLKTTCLWLKNLPYLVNTNLLVSPNCGYSRLENKKKSFVESLNHNSITRSKTFRSVAIAMAKAWG